jgi:hypothetical protein
MMNDTFINRVQELLDYENRNKVFCLTSRQFREFETAVMDALEKAKPRKPVGFNNECWDCGNYLDAGVVPLYCPSCGQAIDWNEVE